MPSTPSSPAQYVRRGLLKISDATVLEAVDALDLRANARISAVVGMPLRSLQQRRDVTTFAGTAPIAAVKGLLELLAMEPLEKVIEALGDHSETPSYEQLAAAVDQLLANGSTDDDMVALLTFAIGEDFPAGPHCRRLLEVRAEFALPELPDVAPSSSLIAPKEVDAEVREQRRARREEEKKKRAKAPARPVRPAKSKGEKKAAATTPTPVRAGPATVPDRRRAILTPGELERFSPEHPFVGTVVLVEVPFDSVDPIVPEQRAKARPALVVAASDTGVLVRGIYSNPATTRVLFQPWRRLGLDHVSYIDGDRVAVALGNLDELERLGRLADDEWNGLV
jgi:hypothetical protein